MAQPLKGILSLGAAGFFATPEEMHEAMVRGAIGILEDVPGLEPLRQAARGRSEQRAITEEDAGLAS